MSQPQQVRAAGVLTAEPLDGYTRLVLDARALSTAEPGQFVAVAAGGEGSGWILRRAFSIHDVDPAAGTVSVVVAAHGAGTRWITERRVGDTLDVVGPLGHGFTAAEAGQRLVLVGGGYGSAPFAWTARAALAAGAQVHAIVGAASTDRLCDVAGIEAALAGQVHVTTDDGSAGRRGRVTDALADVLAALLDSSAAPIRVAACGPMGMLRAVAETAWAADAGSAPVVVEVAVEEAMACGIGVCMTCVLPVVDDDGATRMTRACTAGPVLRADRIRWDAVGPQGASVPADCQGAPPGGAV